MDARARRLAEMYWRDQLVIAGLQSYQQAIRAFGLLGGALDDAAHQIELRIVAAMQLGVDGLHADALLFACSNDCARSRARYKHRWFARTSFGGASFQRTQQSDCN